MNPQSAIRNPLVRAEPAVARQSTAGTAGPEGWLTAAEAAGHLGRSKRSVQADCAAGRLTAQMITHQWYVSPDAHPALRIATGDLAPGPAPAGTGLAGLTAPQRQRAFDRLESIRNFLQALGHKPASMSLGEYQARWCETWAAMVFADGLPAHRKQLGRQAGRLDRRISPSSLRRWLKKYRQSGVMGLIDRRGGFRKPAEFSPEAAEFILGLYLSQNRPGIPYIYTIALGRGREHGWRIPSLRTVRRFLTERTDPKLIAAGREPKKFRDRCVPFIKRDWTLVAAMECWVGDHRQFDVLVPHMVWNRHKNREEVRWHRPWITAYLDCRTWQPVGWVIDFDSPDGDRVMGAFCNGIEACGSPEHAILDNGKDFRKYEFAGGRVRRIRKSEKYLDQKHFEPLLESLGVQVHWTIPYNAKAKIIEPWFKIVAGQFDKLWPTYCGNSPERKPEKLKKLRKITPDLALFNIDIFRRAFKRWAGVYSLAASPAIAAGGRSPLRAIAELRRPDFQPVRPSTDALALLQTRSKGAPVRANGVWVAAFQRYYWSAELEGRRAASGRDTGRHVVYRYRPSDPSRVWVFDFKSDRFLCMASPYVGGGLNPLARTEAEQEQLADAMSLQRRLARETNAEVKRLKLSTAEMTIDLYANGLKARGAMDDPATINVPAPAVIKLIGDGEIDRAAQAGRKHKEQRRLEEGRREAAIKFLSTGTDEQPVRKRAAGPLEMLSGDPAEKGSDNDSGDVA